MSFHTYSSPIAQTIRTVESFDGTTTTYVFTPGAGGIGHPLGAAPLGLTTTGSSPLGGYTPVTQEEAWIFEQLAANYGLT